MLAVVTASRKPNPNHKLHCSSTIAGIRDEFKGSYSVQMSDVHIDSVKVDGEESNTEFYIIGTIRAENSFGGYGDSLTVLTLSSTEVRTNSLGCICSIDQTNDKIPSSAKFIYCSYEPN